MLAIGKRPAQSARPDVCGEAADWPAPRPLSVLSAVCPFDPEMLPETLWPWVTDLADRLQVPPDYPASALIVMLAGAIGRRAYIHPQRQGNWTVVPNLWGAIIGRSGVMKSPVLHAVMGPLQRRQSLAMTVYASERDVYQRQLQQYAQKRSRRCTTTTWDAETPTPPVCTRYLVNEATIEKVHMILQENPQGILYLRDELSGWMAQLEQRGRERDRAFFLETWDGNSDFAFDRVGRGTVYARNLCLSVFGGLQPARLQRYLADAVTGGAGDDGFMQRFQLVVWPDVQPNWKEIDRVPDSRAEGRVEQILDRLLQISPDDPFRARFSAAAQERLPGDESWSLRSVVEIWSLPLNLTWPNAAACYPSWRCCFIWQRAGARKKSIWWKQIEPRGFARIWSRTRDACTGAQRVAPCSWPPR